MAGWCGKFLWICLILYTSILGLSLYKILYPPSCSYLYIMNHNSTAFNQYKQHCYEPLWSTPDYRVNMNLYLGKLQPQGNHIWSVENHSISQALSSEISFELPSGFSQEDDTITGWLILWNSNQKLSNKTPKMIFSFNIAEKRYLTFTTPTNRFLLKNDSETHESAVKNYNLSIPYLHWKYTYSPLLIRYVPLYTIVDSKTYQETFLQPMKRQNNPAKRHNATDSVYNPLIWLDDLSITTKHYEIISFPPLSPITIQFQYLPTSPLRYFFKFIMFLVLKFFTFLSTLNITENSLSLNTLNINTVFSSPSIPTLPSSLDPMIDELRYYLSDDHLYIFFLSTFITYIHFYLEYLVFYHDYNYFVSTNKSHHYQGISLSTHIYSLFRSIVLFLYLINASSSYIILFSVFKDILYALWKLSYLLQHFIQEFMQQIRWISLPLSLSFPIGYTHAINTKTDPKLPSNIPDNPSNPSDLYLYYDYICSLHAILTTFPLFIGLACYNLMTYRYASWYTWILNTLMDSIYYFGFISMIPQLYINYKLHSVAHLPIHALFYKLFQTVIDDIFALLVKMPWKHKLMTLRDDIIFIFFIYQWWVYPSDKKRINEYGYQYSQRDDPAQATTEGDGDGKEEGKQSENSNQREQ